MAIAIVLTVSVTANGALGESGEVGTAVALNFCVQGLVVGAIGTLAVFLLGGDTAWPLVSCSSVMALVTLAEKLLSRR